MRKFLIVLIALTVGVLTVKAALDTYTGVQVKTVLAPNTVNTAAITGASVDVRSGKGIGSWLVSWTLGTNTAGNVTFVLQNSAAGSAWSNATAASAITITGTTPAAARATLVDMAVLSRYVRVLAFSTNQGVSVSSTLQYHD